MYPPGQSPYGVADMSGNVWEWCLNEYEKPERIQEEGDAYRVLRGGSWYYSGASASALARYYHWYNPRYDNYGFRLVGVRSSTLFRPFSGGEDLPGFRNLGGLILAAGRPSIAGPVPAMSAHLEQVVRRPRRRRRKAPGWPGLHARAEKMGNG